MERKEAELLNRLHETQNNQRKAYTSLENMVSVGYNYYSQCYDLKSKKQKELYPKKESLASIAKREPVMQPNE
jgi:hypothetical protein